MNQPEPLSIGVLVSSDADQNVLRDLSSESICLIPLGPLKCVSTDAGGRIVNAQANEFANRLMTGGLDTVVFMTGVAIRQLVSQIARTIPEQRFLDCLIDSTTIAGSPAAAQALRNLGVEPAVALDANSTWRDVLVAIDHQSKVTNLNVALEHSSDVHSISAGLEARGAHVFRFQYSRWRCPAPRTR